MSAIKRIGIAIGAILLAVLVLWAGTGSRIDFKLGTTPGNPGAGVVRLWANSGTGNLECLNSSGGSCLPTGGSITLIQGSGGINVSGGSGPTATISPDTTVLTTFSQMGGFDPNFCTASIISGSNWGCAESPCGAAFTNTAGHPCTMLVQFTGASVAAGATTLNHNGGQKALYVLTNSTNPASGNLVQNLIYWVYYCSTCNSSVGAWVAMNKSN